MPQRSFQMLLQLLGLSLAVLASFFVPSPAFGDSGCWGRDKPPIDVPGVYLPTRTTKADPPRVPIQVVTHKLRFLSPNGVRTELLEGPPAPSGAAGYYRVTIDRCYTEHLAEYTAPLSLVSRVRLFVALSASQLLPWFLVWFIIAAIYARYSRSRDISWRTIGRELGICALVLFIIALAALMTVGGGSWLFVESPPAKEVTVPPQRVELRDATPTEQHREVNKRAARNEPAEFEDPCPESGSCRNNGRCEFVTGECRAVSDRDCAFSKNCRKFGRCVLAGERCVATSTSCPSWDECAKPGGCVLSGDRCALSDDWCAQSAGCKEVGSCAAHNDRCVPTDTNHCETSKVCAQSGRCGLRDGKCAATEPWHCQRAEVCREKSACTPGIGQFRGTCVTDAIFGLTKQQRDSVKSIDTENLFGR